MFDLLLLLVAACSAITTSVRIQACPCVASRPPAQLYPVVRVLDGDTILLRFEGDVVSVRLRSIDTEERISARPLSSPDKPRTVLGEETALWLEAWLAEVAPDGVGLRFGTNGRERDAFGRLLSHVVLPGGTDLNLLLVRRGLSPYFDKYGSSLDCHAAFVAAQAEARAAGRGIWSSDVNVPRTPGAASARRNYERLLPWWRARALAIDRFRRAPAGSILDARDVGALRQAAEHGTSITLFGEVARVIPGPEGSWQVELRAGFDGRLHVRVGARDWEGLQTLRLDERNRAPLQNFVFVTGVVVRRGPDVELRASDAKAWRLAGPDP